MKPVMLKWSCAQRKRWQNIDLPSQGQEGQVVKSLALTTENHIPLNQLMLRMVTSLFCIQRGSNFMEKERAFRELNFLSWLGSKAQSTSCPPQGEQLKFLLSKRGKSNSKGIFKGLFLVNYDSLQTTFLLPFTLSMRKLIFLTKIALAAAVVIPPPARFVGTERITPWREMVSLEAACRRKKDSP